MHDYEALHYDKEQLKEACEWHGGGSGRGGAGPGLGVARCGLTSPCSPAAAGHCGGPGDSDGASRVIPGSSR